MGQRAEPHHGDASDGEHREHYSVDRDGRVTVAVQPADVDM
jgi:hypothetical protein